MPDPVLPLKLPLRVELPDGETCELVDADGKVIATDAECAEDNLFSVQESKSHFEQLAHFANRHPDLNAEVGLLKAERDELREGLEALVKAVETNGALVSYRSEVLDAAKRKLDPNYEAPPFTMEAAGA